MSDPARDLLLRDAIEITLVIDADSARDLPDDIVEQVLGREALALLRHQLAEYDDDLDC